MKKWLALLAFIILAGLGFTGNAFAQITTPTTTDSNITTATSWCYSMVNPNANPASNLLNGFTGGVIGSLGLTNHNDTNPIISSLVECFTDTTQGIIPSVTQSFMSQIQPYFIPFIRLLCLFAIAWYGVRIMIGDVQRLTTDTFILGLKLAGIFYFLTNAPVIYVDMINITQYLAGAISTGADSLHTNGVCTGSNLTYVISQWPANATTAWPANNSQWQQNLWARWDCIFQYLLGFSAAGFATASIVSFLLLMLYSASVGIMIFFAALGMIVGLLVGAFRFIHVYLMSVLALSFLFCFGYLLMPMLLFRNTFEYFRKWLTLIFGYILTPVIMFGFMSLMLVALDVALFTGKYSVFCTIGGNQYCGATAAISDGNLFSGMTQNLDDSGGNSSLKPNMMQAFWLALNNPHFFSQSCHPTPTNEGGLGYTCDTGESGQSLDNPNNPQPTMSQVGLPATALNLPNLALSAGSSCILATEPNGSVPGTPANCPWLQNVLISVAVAAILLYIMISLLSYIPTLASNLTADLISQDFFSAKGRVLGEQVFGEGTAKQLVGAGKNIATGVAERGRTDTPGGRA